PPSSPPLPYTTLFRSKSGMPCPPPGCGRLAAFALAAACGAAAALPAAAQRAPETPIALPAAGRDRGLENCAYALGRLFAPPRIRSEEHTSELQSRENL